jgi:pimeloyl-ACP methyl ester carboxylesterase
VRLEWGADSPSIRQLFAASMIPDATKEQIDSFNELQRRATSAECAARYLETTADFDVAGLLPQVSVPTLVMHARGDTQVPLEAGRQMAAGIPNARFVALQGNNHVLLEQDPGMQRFFEEIDLFLAR